MRTVMHRTIFALLAGAMATVMVAGAADAKVKRPGKPRHSPERVIPSEDAEHGASEGEGKNCLLVARFKTVKDPVTGEETMVPLPPICFD